MDYAAYQDLLVQLDSENYQKAGLVIDVRFNGGGHTATFILDLLARQSMLHSSFRGQPAVSSWHISGNRVLQRPTVLITNESSGSNTEMLSEAYRRLGLGLVVGHPTAGAVISTTQPSLIDGGNMALPHLRVATLAGEDLEGTGRPVDIDVALPLSDPARGQDTQIAAAVQALVAQLGPAT
jgi:C-terminal processing protease CtpA/Prc